MLVVTISLRWFVADQIQYNSNALFTEFFDIFDFFNIFCSLPFDCS